MFRNKELSKTGAACLGIALLCAGLASMAARAGSAAATGDLTGVVLAEDAKTPLEGVVVKIKGLDTKKEFSSQPSDKDGNYKITAIPEGKYTLGVETKEGKYDLEVSIQIKAGETAKLPIVLRDRRQPAGATPASLSAR